MSFTSYATIVEVQLEFSDVCELYTLKGCSKLQV